MKSKFSGLSTNVGKKKPPEEDTKGKVGRPRHSAADSRQVSVHISDAILLDVREKLVRDPQRRTFSKLVEDFLTAYAAGKIEI